VLSPRALLDLPLLPDRRWVRWFEAAGIADPKATFARTRFATYELDAAATTQGMGVALLSPLLYGDLLENGALVAPFSTVVEGPESYWILWRDDAPAAPFVRWLRARVASSSRRRPTSTAAP
jgi:LysR family glycine cleavage system transcriptional activator